MKPELPNRLFSLQVYLIGIAKVAYLSILWNKLKLN